MPKDPAIEGTRKFIMRYSNDNQNRFNREMNSLTGVEYCRVYLALLEYCIPKLNRTEVAGEDGAAIRITFGRLEPDEDKS